MISSRTKRIRFLVILAASLFVSGCTTLASAPGWVNGDSPPSYAKKNFMSALGTGATLEAAQVSAKSELSRIFSAKLRSEIALIDQSSTVDGRSIESSELFVHTKISTQIELQAAEVPLHWRDPKTGEVWALAVLERRKECLRIRSEGRDLNTRLDVLARDAESESNPLTALRTGIQAVKLGIELDQLQARSRVLGNQCLTRRSISTGSLKARVDRGLRGLSFVISASEMNPKTGRPNGPLPQLRERIAGNLTQMGFQVGPAAGASVIPVEARLRLHRVRRGTEWIEYRWEGSAEIGSPVSGAADVIAVESEGSESHPEDSTARLRARRKGELELSRQLDALLKAFLEES